MKEFGFFAASKSQTKRTPPCAGFSFAGTPEANNSPTLADVSPWVGVRLGGPAVIVARTTVSGKGAARPGLRPSNGAFREPSQSRIARKVGAGSGHCPVDRAKSSYPIRGAKTGRRSLEQPWHRRPQLGRRRQVYGLGSGPEPCQDAPQVVGVELCQGRPLAAAA